MTQRRFYIIILFSLLAASSLTAQVAVPKDWNTEKIRGTRLVPYFSYSGNPYLNDKFETGEIELADGVKIGKLHLQYSTYRDEVIYFNPSIAAQIIIDKISLKGFSVMDNKGLRRIFRQLYYDGFLPGNRFFEVLSEGEESLLVYRKVDLQNCPPYTDKGGTIMNMEYQQAFEYYLYNGKKEYEPIRIGRNSLLSKFDKSNMKLIKKLLRKNKVSITDEAGLVRAWNLIVKSGISIKS